MDIDGGEMVALRGMSKILDTQPDILLEIHPCILPSVGSSAAEVCDYLRTKNYLFYYMQSFRDTTTASLSLIPDFNKLSSRSGDMIFVTKKRLD